MPRSLGVKLVAHGGHSHWADPTLREVVVGDVAGYGLGADCDLGGVALIHWLAPDPARRGRYIFTDAPHVWEHPGEAYDALEVYRTQE
jgi:hypothetical protein